jgi:predicted permease
MFLRSLSNLLAVDTGFRRENVMRVRIDPSSAGYKEDVRLTNLYEHIEEKLNASPAVRAASCSLFMFNEGTWNNPIWVQGYASGHRDVEVHHNVVGEKYFAAMGIPVLAGRTFGREDSATSQKVGILGETMARTLFPEGSPIGRHYGRGPENAGDIEVIGVVKDVKYNSLDEDAQPGDYLPYSQNQRYLNDIEVRYTGDPSAVASSIRYAIHDVDRALPISEIMTLDEQVAKSVTNQRLVARLSSFFGLAASFLCCIGIYGLTSYLVSRRNNEIGVRMALGAHSANVLWMVIKETLLLAMWGVAIGVPSALACDRVVSSMLFGVHSAGAIVFASLALMMIVSGFAGYLPARRASRVDPMEALRYE